MKFGFIAKHRGVWPLGAAALWPLTAHAQQAKQQRRIGVRPRMIPKGRPVSSAFLQALQQLGWIDRRNIQIFRRFTNGDADRARAAAAELVALAPDVVLPARPLRARAAYV